MNDRFIIFSAALSIVIIFVVSISLYKYGTPHDDPVKSGAPKRMSNTPLGGYTTTHQHIQLFNQQMTLNHMDTYPNNFDAKSNKICRQQLLGRSLQHSITSFWGHRCRRHLLVIEAHKWLIQRKCSKPSRIEQFLVHLLE